MSLSADGAVVVPYNSDICCWYSVVQASQPCAFLKFTSSPTWHVLLLHLRYIIIYLPLLLTWKSIHIVYQNLRSLTEQMLPNTKKLLVSLGGQRDK